MTYALALAACVERYGEPESSATRTARWRLPGGFWLWLWGVAGGVVVGVDHAVMDGLPAGGEFRRMVDEGDPLPDAIDAAVRWTAEHNDPTKGP